MRPSSALVFALLLTACGLAVAGLDPTATMQYSHQAGATATGDLTARIEGLELGGGVPMAVTGSLQVTLTVEVLEVDEEGVARVRMSFGEMRGEFMGEKSTNDGLEPIEFGVDRLGRIVDQEEVEAAEVDLLASGGVPVQLLGVLAAVVQMPDQPVPAGEQWTVTTDSTIPGVGDVSMQTCTQVTEVGDGTATFSSIVQVQLPELTTPNPLGQGDVTIRQGQLVFEELVRVVDLESGFVTSASGSMTMNCLANLGGMGEMPLKVLGSFELSPAAEVEEEQQGQVAPPAQPAPQAPGPADWARMALRQIQALLAVVPWPWGGR